ncbi:hypothetical protein [Moorella sp. E306M]|uniref:hypothetical protein n=1 Tax=Moorella sp. E306M TaxID=2572683 RepID=UPI0010FFC246|nr:hypothetical protein [Moorella sp. E306M]GEA17676.1 hypothetical protein E306M_08100 [Moorella sp. E306M]
MGRTRKMRRRERRYHRLLTLIEELYENQRSMIAVLGEHMVKIRTLSRQLAAIREEKKSGQEGTNENS